MTETQSLDPRTWFSKLSLRDLFAVIVFIVGVGMWWSAQQYAVADMKRQITELHQDVEKLETRIAEKDRTDTAADKMIGMLEYRLNQIEQRLGSIDTNMRKMAQ